MFRRTWICLEHLCQSAHHIMRVRVMLGCPLMSALMLVFICMKYRQNKSQSTQTDNLIFSMSSYRKWNINLHTSQQVSPEGSCLEPSPSPSKQRQRLPGNPEHSLYPSARRALNIKHDVSGNIHKPEFQTILITHKQRPLWLLHLTSSRLSPTSATTNWCPCFSLIRAAFSEAYMLVKSNMATSGWP